MSLGTDKPLTADDLRKSLLGDIKRVEKQQKKKEKQDNIAYDKLDKEKIDLSTSLQSLQSTDREIARRIEAIGVTNVTDKGRETSGEIKEKLESITKYEKALAKFIQDQEGEKKNATSQITQIETELSKFRQEAAEALALSNAKFVIANKATALEERSRLLAEAQAVLERYEQQNASALTSTKKLEQTRASIKKLEQEQAKALKA